MSGPLEGAVALVTGASSGIGAAISRRLARLGATVVLVGRRADALDGVRQEIEAAGGAAETAIADVADLSAITAAIDGTVQRHGRLDVVVSSAGVASLAPFVPAEPGSWQSMIDANVSGFVNTAHTAMPHLLAAAADGPRGVADFVSISSTSGRRPLAGNNIYSATKHAVTALSEAMRQEVTERMVRVGIVSPGMVDTPMTEAYRSVASSVFLTVDDVADAVEFMITRPAGTAINEMIMRSTHQAV
ncbi:SDR family oxidoreductase [Nakamurella leprariae]|uniref:SDR family oxidoreductase n=1 Tax=Nakamurella leprariae TaxID=2803911 RepID=A0A939C0A4_9ACTN|nr:SDR family oxidoreductase [Nakamurella leprariae]MBM9468551.1 SDR family oxidoreductase [Nakamurella leprariae]